MGRASDGNVPRRLDHLARVALTSAGAADVMMEECGRALKRWRVEKQQLYYLVLLTFTRLGWAATWLYNRNRVGADVRFLISIHLSQSDLTGRHVISRVEFSPHFCMVGGGTCRVKSPSSTSAFNEMAGMITLHLSTLALPVTDRLSLPVHLLDFYLTSEV